MTEANPFGLPEMVAMPGSESCPTTTAAAGPAPASTAKTTAAAKEKVYITHSLAFEQDFGDKTEDDLMADTAFTASLTTGLVDAVSAAITEFAGKIDASSILLEKFTLSAVRRLTAGTTRRLAVKSLNVDYGVEIPEGVTTDPSALGDTLVANKAAFESTMTASYKAAYEANTGEAPKGFTGVKASDTAGVKTVTVAPPTPTPSPTPTPTPTPTPSPAGPAPTPGAPAPPAPPAEEESDNTGMIVGIIVGVVLGVGVLGGVFYMYKKKKADS